MLELNIFEQDDTFTSVFGEFDHVATTTLQLDGAVPKDHKTAKVCYGQNHLTCDSSHPLLHPGTGDHPAPSHSAASVLGVPGPFRSRHSRAPTAARGTGQRSSRRTRRTTAGRGMGRGGAWWGLVVLPIPIAARDLQSRRKLAYWGLCMETNGSRISKLMNAVYKVNRQDKCMETGDLRFTSSPTEAEAHGSARTATANRHSKNRATAASLNIKPEAKQGQAQGGRGHGRGLCCLLFVSLSNLSTYTEPRYRGLLISLVSACRSSTPASALAPTTRNWPLHRQQTADRNERVSE